LVIGKRAIRLLYIHYLLVGLPLSTQVADAPLAFMSLSQQAQRCPQSETHPTTAAWLIPFPF